MSSPRFEVVHTDAGYHARYKAANGRIGWTTEVYKTRASAINAVESLASYLIATVADYPGAWDLDDEIRDVDERTPVDVSATDPADLPPEEAGQALLRTPIDTPEET